VGVAQSENGTVDNELVQKLIVLFEFYKEFLGAFYRFQQYAPKDYEPEDCETEESKTED
jgi:hypothetical protein